MKSFFSYANYISILFGLISAKFFRVMVSLHATIEHIISHFISQFNRYIYNIDFIITYNSVNYHKGLFEAHDFEACALFLESCPNMCSKQWKQVGIRFYVKIMSLLLAIKSFSFSVLFHKHVLFFAKNNWYHFRFLKLSQ